LFILLFLRVFLQHSRLAQLQAFNQILLHPLAN
jgi:hypothetical protein